MMDDIEVRDVCFALARPEEAKGLQCPGNPFDQLILVSPYCRVQHAVLAILHAGFLQRLHAIRPIMLKLSVLGFYGVAGASGA